MRASIQQYVDEQSELPPALIKKSVPDDCPIESLIVFPGVWHLSGTQLPGHIKRVALMRLADGTVWMLSTLPTHWTDDLLQTAARALSKESANAYTKASIERFLCMELGGVLPSLERLVTDSIDWRQWPVREIAYLIYRRCANGRHDDSISQWARNETLASIERALLDGLDDSLQEFVDGLNPQAFDVAMASGQFNHRLYNYLAHESYSRFRIQFAETFPSLILTSVLPGKGDLGTELRSIVDAGAPAIKTLADRWHVRPGVIRHLVGKMAGDVGVQWSRSARGLALALNALRPQDLPGDEASEWAEFNHAVAIGQRLFGREIWESTAALEWLRECMNRYRRGPKEALEAWLPSWHEVPRIIRFRNNLVRSLRRDSVIPPASSPNEVTGPAVDVMDSLVLTLATANLARLASRFEEELEISRRETDGSPIVPGKTMLPLFPGEFMSQDGTRVIRPFTNATQLKLHGIELNNCLADSSRAYLRRGSRGTSFVVGLFERATGVPRSTASISVIRRKGADRYGLVVRQHTAKRNAVVSSPCARAMRELMQFCQTVEVRAHLENSWRQMSYRPDDRSCAPGPEMDVIMARAVRRTLGDAVYDELLSNVQARLS